MRSIEDIVGLTIATDLTPSQRQLVQAAAAENETGVERLAQRIMANPNTRSPVPTFLSAIKRRQHIARPAGERSSATRLSALEKAERLYHAKIAHLNEHGALDQGWNQNSAIAYAVDYTDSATDITEAALRDQIGVPYAASPPPVATFKALHVLLNDDETGD